MKVEKRVLELMIYGIKETRDETHQVFNNYIEALKKCTTVEAVMKTKRDLLLDLSDKVFPMSTNTCYFCIDTNYDCAICGFAKSHKKCDQDKKSDYCKITNALDKLQEAFSCYYKNEVYPEGKKENG